jgi:arabinose-5-phosphate isomerase
VTLADALLEMTRKGLGMTAIVDVDGRAVGVFTDGDLRRTLDRPLDIRAIPIDEVMTRDPRTILPQRLAAEAVQVMDEHKINGLLAADEAGRLVGALNMHDLLRAGVV